MGLDQKFIVRINSNEVKLEMRKLYPVHEILCPIKGMVMGQIILEDDVVKDMLTKLNDWRSTALNDYRYLRDRYASGTSAYDMPAQDYKRYINFMQLEAVDEVIRFFNENRPTKEDDVTVFYTFDC